MQDIEKEKIITIAFRTVKDEELPSFARKFRFDSTYSTVRDIEVTGYYVLKKLSLGRTDLSLYMRVKAPLGLGLGFLSPTGISTNLNKLLSPLPFRKIKNSSGSLGTSPKKIPVTSVVKIATMAKAGLGLGGGSDSEKKVRVCKSRRTSHVQLF